jgi:hypothetical protein
VARLGRAVFDPNQPHRPVRGAAALGGAAGIERLEGPEAPPLGNVRVAEDDAGNTGKAQPQALEPPWSGPGVVNHG